MSLTAIGKGLVTICKGVANGDVVQVAKGVGGTALGTCGTVIRVTISEAVGEALSKGGEAIVEDEV